MVDRIYTLTQCWVRTQVSAVFFHYSSVGITSGSSSVSQSRGTNNAQLFNSVSVNKRTKTAMSLRRSEGNDMLSCDQDELRRISRLRLYGRANCTEHYHYACNGLFEFKDRMFAIDL